MALTVSSGASLRCTEDNKNRIANVDDETGGVASGPGRGPLGRLMQGLRDRFGPADTAAAPPPLHPRLQPHAAKVCSAAEAVEHVRHGEHIRRLDPERQRAVGDVRVEGGLAQALADAVVDGCVHVQNRSFTIG